jgi:hypothetical protein
VTSVELATLSTAMWLIATVALFVLLASWSAGESWGLTSTLVQGVRSWADRDRRTVPITSPFRESLRPILDPYAFARRNDAAAGAPVEARAGSRPEACAPGAEIVELGERRLQR